MCNKQTQQFKKNFQENKNINNFNIEVNKYNKKIIIEKAKYMLRKEIEDQCKNLIDFIEEYNKGDIIPISEYSDTTYDLFVDNKIIKDNEVCVKLKLA